MSDPDVEVEVEVLLKPPAPERKRHVDSVSDLKPDPGDIEHCRRWFSSHGFTAHATEFGAVCYGSRSLVEKIFRTRLVATDGQEGEPPFAPDSELHPPDELAPLIESITLPGRPIFFP